MFPFIDNKTWATVSMEEAMLRLRCTESELYKLIDSTKLVRPKPLLVQAKRRTRKVYESGLIALELSGYPNRAQQSSISANTEDNTSTHQQK